MPLDIGRYKASSADGGPRADQIEAIGIDEAGGLWVKPAALKFPYIYREATEVGWDANRLCLTSPKPRVRSHTQWFEQILRAAREQGAILTIATSTSWVNIDEHLKQAIIERGTPT